MEFATVDVRVPVARDCSISMGRRYKYSVPDSTPLRTGHTRVSSKPHGNQEKETWQILLGFETGCSTLGKKP